jgi:hypothetical protein
MLWVMILNILLDIGTGIQLYLDTPAISKISNTNKFKE